VDRAGQSFAANAEILIRSAIVGARPLSRLGMTAIFGGVLLLFPRALGASAVVSREIVVEGVERPMMKKYWACSRGLKAYPDANPARDAGKNIQ